MVKVTLDFACRGFGLPHGVTTTSFGHRGDRVCKCGCGQTYISPVVEQEFINDAHKYAAPTERRWFGAKK